MAADTTNVQTQLIIEDDPDEDAKQDEVSLLKLQAYGVMILLVTIVIGGVFYIISDLVSSATNTTFDSSIQTITYSVVLLATGGGAYYGLYFSHRYGGTTEQIAIIEAAAEVLKQNNKIFDEQATSLSQEVENLTALTDNNIRKTQNRFASVVNDGKEIGRIGKLIKDNDKQTAQFFNDIKEILRLTNLLQRQIRKNKLISMFYELEYFGDDKDGLSKDEYNKLLSRLDKDTADAFREVTSFRKMDRDLNGTIDSKEFKRALDKVYDRLDQKDKLTIQQNNKTQNAQF